MKSSLSIFATPDDTEAAFYSAFSRCDHSAMGSVWADDEVICVHPGSQAIVGYAAVMRSWSHIFSNAELPDIKMHVIQRTVNETLAVHVVEERIATGASTSALVLATNVYYKLESGWLMVEHHGSISQAQAGSPVLQ